MSLTNLGSPAANGSLDFTYCPAVFQSAVGLVSVINSLPCYHGLPAIIALPNFVARTLPFVLLVIIASVLRCQSNAAFGPRFATY